MNRDLITPTTQSVDIIVIVKDSILSVLVVPVVVVVITSSHRPPPPLHTFTAPIHGANRRQPQSIINNIFISISSIRFPILPTQIRRTLIRRKVLSHSSLVTKVTTKVVVVVTTTTTTKVRPLISLPRCCRRRTPPSSMSC